MKTEKEIRAWYDEMHHGYHKLLLTRPKGVNLIMESHRLAVLEWVLDIDTENEPHDWE